MTRAVRDAMNPEPTILASTRTVTEVARRMRDEGIGTVLVHEHGAVCGLLTDRDIVVRLIAEERDIQGTTLGEICSEDLHTVGPDDPLDDVVATMQEHGLRRVPVLDGEEAVGILSITDVERSAQVESGPVRHE